MRVQCFQCEGWCELPDYADNDEEHPPVAVCVTCIQFAMAADAAFLTDWRDRPLPRGCRIFACLPVPHVEEPRGDVWEDITFAEKGFRLMFHYWIDVLLSAWPPATREEFILLIYEAAAAAGIWVRREGTCRIDGTGVGQYRIDGWHFRGTGPNVVLGEELSWRYLRDVRDREAAVAQLIAAKRA
jgi:hypothetical protein